MLKFALATVGIVFLLAGPATAATPGVPPSDFGETVPLAPGAGLGLSKRDTPRPVSTGAPLPASTVTPVNPGLVPVNSGGASGSGGFGIAGLWIALLGIFARPVTYEPRSRGGGRRTAAQFRATKPPSIAIPPVVPGSATSPSNGPDTVLARYDTRLPFPPTVLVVTIGGFASSPGNTFDVLLSSMGIPEEQVANFDWNWDGRFASSEEASRRASIDHGLLTLGAWLSTLPEDVEISFIGHSKGAVLIAEFLAAQDRVCGYDDRVRTAMLLDPPLAGGVLGQAQSVGEGVFGLVPNDGGFRRTWNDGTDKLNDLGRSGDVVVRIIRNPDAMITNVGPAPGAVMYDLVDDGAGSPLDAAISAEVPWYIQMMPSLDLASRVSVAARRIGEAHSSIVDDPQVALVTRQEIIAPGSSRWRAGPVSDLPAEPIGPDQRRWGNCPAPSQ